mmetsp:Transcript_29422/g.94466  ORF Transcript_29422/g.94466 Transcript_29422/m.94466 type:complete len:126 (-) Transcript_29422:311-688(-)
MTMTFRLDIAELEGTWAASYAGELMGVQHRLLVVVKRPWYTFAVTLERPLQLRMCDPAPAEDQGYLARDQPNFARHRKQNPEPEPRGLALAARLNLSPSLNLDLTLPPPARNPKTFSCWMRRRTS